MACRGKISLRFEGYVTDSLQSPILCGAPFLSRNKVVQELHNRRIIIDGKHYIEESSPFCPNSIPDFNVAKISILDVSYSYPGDSWNIHINAPFMNKEYLISPKYESSLKTWQPQISRPSKNGLMSIKLDSDETLPLKDEDIVFKIVPMRAIKCFLTNPYNSPSSNNLQIPPVDSVPKIEIGKDVPKKIRENLIKIHKAHAAVFNGDLRDGYNGYSGNFEVDFNFLNDIPPPINYGCVPSYNKPEDNVLLQLMIDRLEEQKVVAKANSLNVIPRFASPCMLVKKNSARALKEGEYESLSNTEKLRYNRFVLCQNKLNEYVQKIPAKYNKLDETINIVGAHEFIITTDLTDSFWQRHIALDKLPYFAFHSPFKGTYIFLRSTQGFLNQSEGLEELLSCVLHEGIMQGWCRVHADNLYIMGHSMEETVKRWKLVLDIMVKNNLKLSPKKTSCFPEELDLLGWTKKGKFLIPDVHRQNCLLKAPRPTTVKELRSFLGSYRTFYRCKANMSSLLGSLETVTSDKPSSQKLEWTPRLIEDFEKAKSEIKYLDTIYLPKKEDQLVLTSDYSKQGICATLWAIVDSKFLVVSRMSTKLDKSQEHLLPCEGEAIAIYVAGKTPQFKSHIITSNVKTIALLDNKAVVQAANLLKQGKFSSSKLINIVLSSIADLNLTFQHMSGKMGQNFADDHGSRNPIECSDKQKCKICNFVTECAQLMIHPISFLVSDGVILGQVNQQKARSTLTSDIINGFETIPFANKAAMRYLQDRDPVLQRVKELLLAGEAPHQREKAEVKRYMQKNIDITLEDSGCLVVKRRNRKFIERTLIVIPEDVSLGLLQGLHINLNHPSPFQLQSALDTKFFILDRDKKIRQIWESCTLCQSMAKLPTEIHEFKPNQMPSHPGISFTVDVIRTGKKYILVSVENFSGFLTSLFLSSESAENLLDGIVQAIMPLRASSQSLVVIRSDKAPGFKSLQSRSLEMKKLGLDLDLGEVKNKNSTAIADKKIQELENEIKKITVSPNSINVKTLAKATAIVNEKIRNQGLSSKEILFARDQFNQANIPLDDQQLHDQVTINRSKNNVYSSRSKATINREAIPANARKGNVVFLKQEGSKWMKKDMYLVTAEDKQGQMVEICKIFNTFNPSKAAIHPHKTVYNVKQTDIVLAPNQPLVIEPEIVHVVPLEGNYDPGNSSSSDRVYQHIKPRIPLDIKPHDSDEDESDEENDLWIWEESEITDVSTDIRSNALGNVEDLDNQEAATIDAQVNVDEDINQIISDDPLGTTDLDKQTQTRQTCQQSCEFNPNILPEEDDNIIYWDTAKNAFVSAVVIPMNKSVKRKNPYWVNVQIKDTGQQLALNLDRLCDSCVCWRYNDASEDTVTDNFPTSPRRRALDLESDTSEDLAREFAIQPINMQITIQPPPLNLAVPTYGSLEEGRVYQFDTEEAPILGEKDTGGSEDDLDYQVEPVPFDRQAEGKRRPLRKLRNPFKKNDFRKGEG